MVNHDKIHEMVQSEDVAERREAVERIRINFAVLPDKKQALDFLILLTEDKDDDVRLQAAGALGSVFPNVPDKIHAWDYVHHLVKNKDSYVRRGVAGALGSVFPHIPNKKQAWDDVRWLIRDKDGYVRWCVAGILGLVFSYIPDKEQVWADLILLTQDNDDGVRLRAASELSSFFPYISDKKHAYTDLQRLTQDRDSFVRAIANHSLGKASIFKATEAKNEEIFREELEKALKFFEIASKEETFISNPAAFCFPFYRSFHIVTFKNHDAEAEIQEYLAEARNAVEGSESKEKLLEAIENLANALKEVQNAQETDLKTMQCDLDAYRRYCERAADLLKTTVEKAPGATKLIKKGLPIIDERIKKIIAEIQDNANTFCKQTKGTQLEDLGKEINRVGQKLSQVRDPIGLEKSVNNLQIVLSAICEKMIEEEKGEAYELLKKAKEEPYIEDRINLFNMVLSKISTQFNMVQRLLTEFERLRALIEEHYNKEDKAKLLEAVEEIEKSCNDPSKREWLNEKLGWLLTRTSEVSSISSFILALKQIL